MQEENKKEQKKVVKRKEEKKEKREEKEISEESIVRIYDKDIAGNKNVYVGLTKIKGVSFALSNAICYRLNIPKNKKISELTQEEIKKIENFLKNPDIPDFLKNRRRDYETSESKHYLSTELDLRKDFDIRRLKKIRSYKGIRHIQGQPVRGQRTRSHFRKRGSVVGVKRKKEAKKK